MAKYHIRPGGIPEKCRAKQGRCPYGGDSGLENHFDSKAEAQTAIDQTNQRNFMEAQAHKNLLFNQLQADEPEIIEKLQAEINGTINAEDHYDEVWNDTINYIRETGNPITGEWSSDTSRFAKPLKIHNADAVEASYDPAHGGTGVIIHKGDEYVQIVSNDKPYSTTDRLLGVDPGPRQYKLTGSHTYEFLDEDKAIKYLDDFTKDK